MTMRREVTEKLLQLKTLWHKRQGRCEYCNSPTLLIVNRSFVISTKSFDGYDYDESGEPWPFATRDHKIPVSRGGPDTIDNMTLACSPCNHRKDSLTPEEFESVKAWGCDADLMFRQILRDVHALQRKQPKRKKGVVKQEPQQKKKLSVSIDDKGCVWYRNA